MGTNYTVDSSGNLTTAGSITSTSTTSGFLLPKLTTTQRNAIPTPATGLEIFNTTTNQIEFYNGTVWGAVAGTAGVTGSGTTNKVARWAGTTTLAAGAITDTGSVVQMQVSPIIQISSGGGGSGGLATFLDLQDTTSGGATWLHNSNTQSGTFSSATLFFNAPPDAAGEILVVGFSTTSHAAFVDKLLFASSSTSIVTSTLGSTAVNFATARSYTTVSNSLRITISGNAITFKLAVYVLYPF